MRVKTSEHYRNDIQEASLDTSSMYPTRLCFQRPVHTGEDAGTSSCSSDELGSTQAEFLTDQGRYTCSSQPDMLPSDQAGPHNGFHRYPEPSEPNPAPQMITCKVPLCNAHGLERADNSSSTLGLVVFIDLTLKCLDWLDGEFLLKLLLHPCSSHPRCLRQSSCAHDPIGCETSGAGYLVLESSNNLEGGWCTSDTIVGGLQPTKAFGCHTSADRSLVGHSVASKLSRLIIQSCGKLDATSVANLMQACPALDVEVNTVYEN
ncbi:hypothetical protein CEUSTIGMA_g1013.t1 [Chlamydomonas eustigma]|uniref:Uncharacterized protein n=1 Tax=Chlamydomonas eustigma TaxID=1157962 RepID=A0A250WSA5_9CHLO|nr:hypothetical protein CEUSTIGMA_g1013.t1 [Chlamydomonas eustigma]|eukprot:GAX73562.1 hypothetical protein CEUSTIGMA_g1013.t1 [Chlamydomonas eustigma]